jgi:hypothetical protein
VLCSSIPRRKVFCEFHSGVAVAKDCLTPIVRVGLPPQISLFGHPLDQIADRGTGQPHLLAEPACGEILTFRLGEDHEVEGAKVVGAQVVIRSE